MKNIYVLLDSKEEVIGSGTQEEVLRYQEQLLEINKDEKYVIEEREFNGWLSGLTYAGTMLQEYEGVLYPKRNINIADSRKKAKLAELGTIYNGLKNLSKEMSDEDKEHCEKILSYLDKKYQTISEEDIQIKMV